MHQKKNVNTSALTKSWLYNAFWQKVILVLLSFVLYANTIGHDYTQDDAIVIYQNMYTTDGISGIPGIFSNDTFFGFFKDKSKANLVEGGRYRPLTLAMFAIEYQIFGKNPTAGHFINILWFALCGLMIYLLLKRLLIPFMDQEQVGLFAFIAASLFVLHPIHTEVVANIKGRDEIMSMLLSISSLYVLLRFLDHKKWIYLISSAMLFFLGLLSKENTITFLAIMPMALFLFKKKSIGESLKLIVPHLVAAAIFLLIRHFILDLGAQTGTTGLRDLMNNPFIKWNGSSYESFTLGERLATIAFTLGKYIQLLVFPHPLTHDYYPRHIAIMHFGNWKVLLSIFVYLGMIIYAIKSFKKKKLISFGILYFICTISIISNILFPVGTNLAERFMFMPSLAYCIIIAALFFQPKGKYQKPAFIVLILIALFFSWKTVTRNSVWKDDYTLFTTDVKTSTNSAKVLNAAGGALSVSAVGMQDNIEKEKRLNLAIGYLERAIKIHPRYRNAYLLLGNSHYYLGAYDRSIDYYNQCLSISPGYAEAVKNRSITYRDAGRFFGEKQNDLAKALLYLDKAYIDLPEDIETIRLLGVCNGIMQNHTKAIEYFNKWTVLDPENAFAWKNLMSAYLHIGNEEQSLIARQKALSIDPNILDK